MTDGTWERYRVVTRMSSDSVYIQVKLFRASVLPLIPSLSSYPTPHCGPRTPSVVAPRAGITSMRLPRGSSQSSQIFTGPPCADFHPGRKHLR